MTISIATAFNDIAKQVFRLFDIETKEVSFVDRAANKRMFVLLKRNGELEVAAEGEVEVSPTGDGQFVLKDEFADESEFISKSLMISPAVQESVLGAMTNVLRDLMEVGQLLKEADESTKDQVIAGVEKAMAGLGEVFNTYGGAAKQAPSSGMSREVLESAKKTRSSNFGVEVVEGGALTFPSGFPTKLSEYADPVNLKFPVNSKARADNARVRFKQFATKTYKQAASRRVVHNRIVKAQLKFGSKPSVDRGDPLDQLLEESVKERAEAKKLHEPGHGGPLEALAVAVDLLVQISAAVRDAEVSEEAGKNLPEEVLLAIRQVWEILASLTQPSAPADAAPAEVQMADNPTEKGSEPDPRLAAAVDTLKVMGGQTGELLQAVDKRGRKMSGARAKRFRKALDDLLSILGEVSTEVDSEIASQGTAKVAPPKPAKKAVKPKTAPTPAKKTNSAPDPHSAALEAEVVRLRKAHDDQQVQINKLLEAPNAPQGLPVHKGQTNPPEPFVWPRNMNES